MAVNVGDVPGREIVVNVSISGLLDTWIGEEVSSEKNQGAD